MKNRILYLALMVSALSLSSCESFDDVTPPAEYNKILSMKVHGEQNITLYQTGEDTEYPITVIKSGADPQATANASVEVMTENEFREYLENTGMNYKMLPSDCYQLTDGSMEFGSEDKWKTAKLTIRPEKVASYLTDGSQYVIPIITKSISDSILSTANNLVVIPTEVIKPAVSFLNMTNHTLLKEVPTEGETISIPLGLQINNLWSFTAQVAVDPSATTLNSDDYELLDGGKVTFEPGKTAALKIKLNPMKHAIGKLGLKITGIEGKSFDYDKELVALTTRVPKYPLTASMLSTNAQEPSEGPIANVLDGDVNSYFHSAWSVYSSEEHYFEVTLPEAVSSFAFSYTNRASNGNTALSDFSVFVGNDESSLKEIRHYDEAIDNLPTTGKGVFNSGEFKPSSPIKIIRIVNHRNHTGEKYFSLSEFSLYAI